MSHLHTVNSLTRLPLCLRTFDREHDRLLLIEDGVYGAVNEEQQRLLKGLSVFVLLDDLQARGLSSRVERGIAEITMADFVRLCGEADRVINWF
ncbi:MAG: sulfurtransferase complex subunit TusB [Gammaproteobacteria bacterium]|nr:sulfurtransferase complex subunit TusB [Pseudomonadales bacterium]MCP5346199.1 sulfurtransferase complex subunit TusB [Pseudomonadales bacterium]